MGEQAEFLAQTLGGKFLYFVGIFIAMSKKESKKDVYYFPHDYNPTSDPKMLAFVGEYGAIGYGIYWRIVEMLHESQEHVLPLKKYIYSALAKQMLTEVEQVLKIVESCINDYELFDSDDEYFWCNRVLRNVEKRTELIDKKIKAGKASAEARAEKKNNQIKSTDVEHNSTRVEHNSTEGNKLNEIKLNEIKSNEIKLNEISKKIALPFKFSEISQELKTNSQTKEHCVKFHKLIPDQYELYIDWFMSINSDHSPGEIVDFKEWNKHFKEWIKFNNGKLPEPTKIKAKLL